MNDPTGSSKAGGVVFMGRGSGSDMEVWLTLLDDGTWTAPPGGLEKLRAVYAAGIRALQAPSRFTAPPGENVVYETTNLRDPWTESN